VIGLVTTSKQLDLTAADTSKEAERLDKLEAPAKRTRAAVEAGRGKARGA